MSGHGALRLYAKRSLPSPDLPPSVLFSYSNETMTIFDLYPKVGMQFHSNTPSSTPYLGCIPLSRPPTSQARHGPGATFQLEISPPRGQGESKGVYRDTQKGRVKSQGAHRGRNDEQVWMQVDGLLPPFSLTPDATDARPRSIWASMLSLVWSMFHHFYLMASIDAL
jgi:hypothetical protein